MKATPAPSNTRSPAVLLAGVCILIATILAHLWPAGAQAQSSGFALNRFDVSEVGSDWFAGDSLDLRGETRPGVRLAVDWAHKPLVRYDEDGNEKHDLGA